MKQMHQNKNDEETIFSSGAKGDLYHAFNNFKLQKSNKRSQAISGFCLEFGIGTDRDIIKALQHYESSKDNGLSLVRLAFLRKYGRANVVIDRHEANILKSESFKRPDVLEILKKEVF